MGAATTKTASYKTVILRAAASMLGNLAEGRATGGECQVTPGSLVSATWDYLDGESDDQISITARQRRYVTRAAVERAVEAVASLSETARATLAEYPEYPEGGLVVRGTQRRMRFLFDSEMPPTAAPAPVAAPVRDQIGTIAGKAIAKYDVLQVLRCGQWMDYATLRTTRDIADSRPYLQGRRETYGEDFRIARVLEGGRVVVTMGDVGTETDAETAEAGTWTDPASYR